MKQRLAIAATLLKDPDLLIFDEPTNGLDPAGIHEIRATMRGLADRGKTVLVSSHILTEVQQVADTVSIIGRGRLLAEGRVAEILDAAGEQSARVGVADPAAAAGCSSRAGFTVDPGGASAQVDAWRTAPDLAQITRVLAEGGHLRQRAGAGPPRPRVGLPGADRRRAPRRQPRRTERAAGRPGPDGTPDDPAVRGGDSPAAQSPVHRHRQYRCAAGPGRVPVAPSTRRSRRRAARSWPQRSRRTRRSTKSGLSTATSSSRSAKNAGRTAGDCRYEEPTLDNYTVTDRSTRWPLRPCRCRSTWWRSRR